MVISGQNTNRQIKRESLIHCFMSHLMLCLKSVRKKWKWIHREIQKLGTYVELLALDETCLAIIILTYSRLWNGNLYQVWVFNRKGVNFCVRSTHLLGDRLGHGTPLVMELLIPVKPACFRQHTQRRLPLDLAWHHVHTLSNALGKLCGWLVDFRTEENHFCRLHAYPHPPSPANHTRVCMYTHAHTRTNTHTAAHKHTHTATKRHLCK